jgi:hypothetical protein
LLAPFQHGLRSFPVRRQCDKLLQQRETRRRGRASRTVAAKESPVLPAQSDEVPLPLPLLPWSFLIAQPFPTVSLCLRCESDSGGRNRRGLFQGKPYFSCTVDTVSF